MRKLRAIVFDLDDTLYPEIECVRSGFRSVAAWIEHKFDIWEQRAFEEIQLLFEGGSRGDTFDRWLVSRGFPPDEWVSQMVHIYRDHQPRISPFPEARELLQRLGNCYRLGLVSDGNVDVQQRKLTALGLASFFDVVAFSDDWGRQARKPSPKPLKHALSVLGTTGREALYVADNPLKDFLAARRAEMWAVRVRWPRTLYVNLEPPSEEYEPHAEINNLKELDNLLICSDEPFR